MASPLLVLHVLPVAVQNPERAAEAPQRPTPAGLLPQTQKISHPGQRHRVRRAVPAPPLADEDTCPKLLKVQPWLDAPAMQHVFIPLDHAVVLQWPARQLAR